MNSKQRLMASFRGEAVDRPAVSFYEINGYRQNPNDPDPYNIHNDPSWLPLIRLAREESDSIVLHWSHAQTLVPSPENERTKWETWDENGSRFTRRTVRAEGRTLTSLMRRDPEIQTTWTLEHLIKDVDDLKAWLAIPEADPRCAASPDAALAEEAEIGGGGIVMLDTNDAVCHVAAQFDMGTWTVMALTEQDLIMQALERAHRAIRARVDAVSAALPGRAWRIFGPEYASEPYLPPALFRKYVTAFDKELVDLIHRGNGFARIHCHGRLRNILDAIADTGCDAIDPIEPPHQGDITLAEVRERYGDRWTLFGNIEVTDIENLPTPEFEKKIAAALREGVGGKGFVLMPSSAPYGRTITPACLRNYERMIEMARG